VKCTGLRDTPVAQDGPIEVGAGLGYQESFPPRPESRLRAESAPTVPVVPPAVRGWDLRPRHDCKVNLEARAKRRVELSFPLIGAARWSRRSKCANDECERPRVRAAPGRSRAFGEEGTRPVGDFRPASAFGDDSARRCDEQALVASGRAGREGGAALCSPRDAVVHVGDTVLALDDPAAL
jgi:hypothetical protein